MNPDASTWAFDWRRPAWNLRLPMFILISLLGHLFCFYLFQVVYPSTTALLPAAASVAVLNPKNDRDRRVLDWAELRDPAALAAPGFRPELIEKLTPRYEPSFADQSPAFAPLIPAETDRLPSIFGPDGVLAKNPAPALSPPVVFTSHVELTGALRDRLAAPLPALPRTRAYAEPTVLLVGVDPGGTVSHCLPWRSSGKAELDQSAERFARALRFLAAPHYTWAELRFTWGYDEP